MSPLPTIPHAVTTDIGKRSIQQDDYCLCSLWKGEASLFVVLDGHGMFIMIVKKKVDSDNNAIGANGHKVAEYAKNRLPFYLETSKTQLLSQPEQTFKDIFDKVNQEMNDQGKIDTYMSGTTVGLALVYNQQLFIANVGDTRIVLAKQNGQGVALTV